MIYLEDLTELNGKNLVYIYFVDNCPLYCGKTSSFLSRQKEHLFIRGEEYGYCFDKIICLEFNNPLLMDLAEVYYINKLTPSFNEKDVYKDDKSVESLDKMRFIQNEIVNRYCIYQFDLYEALETPNKPNIFSLSIDLIKNNIEKIIDNSGQISLDNYIETVYLPLRQKLMSKSAYEKSVFRFRLLEYKNKDIFL